jgi:short-subunit dehydrogenase
MNIVVTGGTKGIGRAIIETFAGQGFNVFTCARNSAELNDLKKELKEKYPQLDVFAETCDMGNKTQVQNLARSITEKFKTIDILVNNAGVFLPGTIVGEEEDTFETTMNVNIGGSYHLTRGILPVIKKTKGAHIFNICSTASITAYTDGGSYCISKFALLGFSKVLREELKTEGIKVTSILPGATLTNSWAGTTLAPERFMQPSDIASAVLDCYNLKSVVVEEMLMRPMMGDI